VNPLVPPSASRRYLRDHITTGTADRSFRFGGARDRTLTLTQLLTRHPATPEYNVVPVGELGGGVLRLVP